MEHSMPPFPALSRTFVSIVILGCAVLLSGCQTKNNSRLGVASSHYPPANLKKLFKHPIEGIYSIPTTQERSLTRPQPRVLVVRDGNIHMVAMPPSGIPQKEISPLVYRAVLPSEKEFDHFGAGTTRAEVESLLGAPTFSQKDKIRSSKAQVLYCYYNCCTLSPESRFIFMHTDVLYQKAKDGKWLLCSYTWSRGAGWWFDGD